MVDGTVSDSTVVLSHCPGTGRGVSNKGRDNFSALPVQVEYRKVIKAGAVPAAENQLLPSVPIHIQKGVFAGNAVDPAVLKFGVALLLQKGLK